MLIGQDIGPYGAVNPHNIGLMVVLVAGWAMLQGQRAKVPRHSFSLREALVELQRLGVSEVDGVIPVLEGHLGRDFRAVAVRIERIDQRPNK